MIEMTETPCKFPCKLHTHVHAFEDEGEYYLVSGSYAFSLVINSTTGYVVSGLIYLVMGVFSRHHRKLSRFNSSNSNTGDE